MGMMAFDFFCGAGGLTRGLLDAGIKVIAGFDDDEKCRESYERNNAPARFVRADIRKLSVADLKEYSKETPFAEMLFAGCAPCQPFSQQVKNGECRHDATLLSEFGRLIEAALPGQVLMENVPGIARVKGNSTFRRFLRLLKENDYKYVYDVIDARQFGVPQKRRRLVLIALRHIQPSMPPAKHGAGALPFRTVRQAISYFPPIAEGEMHSEMPNHVAASITPLNLDRLRHTPPDGGDRRSWPKSLRLECHTGNYEGHTDVYGRMAWDAPAPTLTGRCHSLSNGRYGHPTQDRAISLREAAALQSFPDGYVFSGSNKHIAQQIGNAVPVKLAEVMGRHIQALVREPKVSAASPEDTHVCPV
ncbi:MAG: DNA cytosine methyltransferase [Phycisphaerae bacterium]|nr:DNA cytosine methyltransferase [Phycisphaerae bacterium]